MKKFLRNNLFIFILIQVFALSFSSPPCFGMKQTLGKAWKTAKKYGNPLNYLPSWESTTDPEETLQDVFSVQQQQKVDEEDPYKDMPALISDEEDDSKEKHDDDEQDTDKLSKELALMTLESSPVSDESPFHVLQVSHGTIIKFTDGDDNESTILVTPSDFFFIQKNESSNSYLLLVIKPQRDTVIFIEYNCTDNSVETKTINLSHAQQYLQRPTPQRNLTPPTDLSVDIDLLHLQRTLAQLSLDKQPVPLWNARKSSAPPFALTHRSSDEDTTDKPQGWMPYSYYPQKVQDEWNDEIRKQMTSVDDGSDNETMEMVPLLHEIDQNWEYSPDMFKPKTKNLNDLEHFRNAILGNPVKNIYRYKANKSNLQITFLCNDQPISMARHKHPVVRKSITQHPWRKHLFVYLVTRRTNNRRKKSRTIIDLRLYVHDATKKKSKQIKTRLNKSLRSQKIRWINDTTIQIGNTQITIPINGNN